MRLGFSPPPLTLSVLLLSCAAAVNANFALYPSWTMIPTLVKYEQPSMV